LGSFRNFNVGRARESRLCQKRAGTGRRTIGLRPQIGFEIGFAATPFVDIIGYIGFDLSISFFKQA
jgi:hypothetical protein